MNLLLFKILVLYGLAANVSVSAQRRVVYRQNAAKPAYIRQQQQRSYRPTYQSVVQPQYYKPQTTYYRPAASRNNYYQTRPAKTLRRGFVQTPQQQYYQQQYYQQQLQPQQYYQQQLQQQYYQQQLQQQQQQQQYYQQQYYQQPFGQQQYYQQFPQKGHRKQNQEPITCNYYYNYYVKPLVNNIKESCSTYYYNGDPYIVCCINPIATSPTTQPTTLSITQNPITQSPFFPQPITTIITTLPTLPPITTTPPPPITTPQPPPPIIIPTPSVQPSAPLIDVRGKTCVGPTPEDLNGVCIDLQQCPVLLNRLTQNPNDQAFKEYLRKSNNVCKTSFSSVCCPNSVPENKLVTFENNCGKSISVLGRVVGGQRAEKGDYPWIALLHYNDGSYPSQKSFRCGGSLITTRHVLTAAHCIRNNLDYVRLGEYDLSIETEAKVINVNIVKKTPHPEYNKVTGRSDLAILHLETNVPIDTYIRPICLPYTPELQTKSFLNYNPFVAGWGRTEEGGSTSDVLQKLQLPILKNDVCRDSYAKMKALKSADQFDSAVICAGELSGGKDTCQGDSGGPLMYPYMIKKHIHYILLGVVSYGLGCARQGSPGVYTSIQYFMPWIKQQIA